MTLTNQSLRELAEKATPGYWRVVFGYSDWGMPNVHMIASGDIDVIRHEDVIAEITSVTPYCFGASNKDVMRSRQQNANASFIAAANPKTILALLDEVEALRKDAERLDWIQRTFNAVQPLFAPRIQGNTDATESTGIWVISPRQTRSAFHGNSLIEAIDTAMRETP
jgi:hypothetical protein